MTTTKSKYWAVVESRKGTLFEGTHTQCWEWLVNVYGDSKVDDLVKLGVKITRIK